MVCCVPCRYYTANNGQQPGCLLVYRDGVSDSELQRVRQDEVRAVIEVRTCCCLVSNFTKACESLGPHLSAAHVKTQHCSPYRPRRLRPVPCLAPLQACAELSPDGSYRPRIVYMVVQKRQHVRLFDASQPQQLRNCEPGTVVDHTIVSPEVCDFYLCSHKEISGAGAPGASMHVTSHGGNGILGFDMGDAPSAQEQ